MYDEMTLDNFKVQSIFNGQTYKCDMGWKLRCKLLIGQFNQDVIY
jgi:hypothetical protein